MGDCSQWVVWGGGRVSQFQNRHTSICGSRCRAALSAPVVLLAGRSECVSTSCVVQSFWAAVVLEVNSLITSSVGSSLWFTSVYVSKWLHIKPEPQNHLVLQRQLSMMYDCLPQFFTVTSVSQLRAAGWKQAGLTLYFRDLSWCSLNKCISLFFTWSHLIVCCVSNCALRYS